MSSRFEATAYGATIEVVASDASLLEALVSALPRGWRLTDEATDRWRFEARREPGGLVVVNGAGIEADVRDVGGAQAALREELRRFVGLHSPEWIFVHAGSVAYGDRVIVLPGSSYAGKSTLVEALVRAGAEFYSDEYAIFNLSGRVVQYREPLILRTQDGRTESETAAEGPDRPLPVGIVALTGYKPGATWAPREVSTAEGIVALLQHAGGVRSRPDTAVRVFRKALTGVRLLAGERGEADETARLLLDALSGT